MSIEVALSKLRSAQICHPNAVQFLIDEAITAIQQAEVTDELLHPEDFNVEVVMKPVVGFAPVSTQGVRVTHKPTGISVTCDAARSQHTNRHHAFEQLRAILAQQPATGEPAQADSSEHLRVIASLGAALRRLSFAAQTTGGTDGPDAELQSAIGQAEQALSLGGIWQAMSATAEPVLFIHPDTFAMDNAHVGAWKPGHELTGYIPLYTHPAPGVPRGAVNLGAHSLASELAQAVAQDDDDPEGHDMSAGLFGPTVSAWLRKVAADFLSHPAPGVPDDVVKDAERYRWLRKSLPAGQGSLTVLLDDRCNGCFQRPVFMGSLDSAIDAAMLTAAQAQKGQP